MTFKMVTVGLCFALGTVFGGNLTLHPSGFGKDAYAAWKAQQGLPDSKGNANQALYFQKMAPTATFSAGVAVVNGIEGTPVAALTNLSWEHRIDGHCGAGAPRWSVGVQGASGAKYTLFLGCAAAAHSPDPTNSNWIIDSYTGTDIVTIGAANAGFSAQVPDITAGTITSLAIIFDEGTDQGTGFVFLDNITVNEQKWTSAADNGN